MDVQDEYQDVLVGECKQDRLMACISFLRVHIVFLVLFFNTSEKFNFTKYLEWYPVFVLTPFCSTFCDFV